MVTSYLLTGDIGGTNSRMYLYEASVSSSSKDGKQQPQPLCEKIYKNGQAIPEDERGDPSVYQKRIISPFLRHCWETLADRLAPLHESEIIACLATAGLVRTFCRCFDIKDLTNESILTNFYFCFPITRTHREQRGQDHQPRICAGGRHRH
jgi:hypothetical protein